MTYVDLFLDIGWYEWILYLPMIFFLFLFFFHKDIDYAFKVNQEYKTPFWTTLFHLLCIPDKYLTSNTTHVDYVRDLELLINGLETKKVLLTRDERKCTLRENSKRSHKSKTFSITDEHTILIDGSKIILPPVLIIQIIHLWKESKKDIPPKAKKTLLT